MALKRRPQTKKSNWEILKHPLIVGVIVAVVGGLITYLVKTSSSNSTVNNGNIANSNVVKVGSNNSGQIAGGNIINQTVLSQSPAQTNLEWLPPELPEEYKNVTIQMGGLVARYDVNLLKGNRMPFGFFFQNLTNEGMTIGLTTNLASQSDSLIPIFITIVERRLYVDCNLPYKNGVILIHGNSPKEEIPSDWDWNHNSNAIEIVNENNVPVFQMVYVRPEKVIICGYFVCKGTSFQISTGKRIKVGTAYYDSNFIKPLFKYPSGLHQGELAN